MTSVAELIDQGIRAYTRGQLAEAERCWCEALAAEPTNARARSYLDVLLGRKDAVRQEHEPRPQAQSRAAEAGRLMGGAQPPAEGERRAASGTVPQAAEVDRGPMAVERRPAAGRDEARVALPAPSTASRSPAIPPAPRGVGSVPLPPPAQQQAAQQQAAQQQAAQHSRMTLSWIDAGSVPAVPPPAVEAGASVSAPAGVPGLPREAAAVPPEAAAAIPAEALAPPAPWAPQAPEQPANGRPERSTLNDYAPSPWDEGPSFAPAVVLGEGDGLDLATVADQSDVRSLVPEQATIPQLFSGLAPRNAVEVWMEGARELFALGDFSGSLEMLEKILKVDPSHEEARRYLKENESTLIAMYESKLGSRDCVPRLAINPEEVMWLNLDHRAGFLLAQIDGAVTYEDLFALSGLPRLDTARILATLLHEGVIQSS